MKTNSAQLEFVDVNRGKPRPPGSGQVIGGFFVFNNQSQRVDQVAYTLGEDVSREHVYHLIQEGQFPNATDISSDKAARACYRIPRGDVLDFLESRKGGAK